MSRCWKSNLLMNYWKVAGALANPKGMTKYSKSPKGVIKKFYYSWASFILIYLKADFTPTLEITEAPPKWSVRVSAPGI